ncbi:MAG: site-2 protease family protein [Promethearchaeota archaeon]
MEILLSLLPWIIISVIFWGFVLLAAYLLRNKKDAVYVFFPLLAMFKTKRLNKIIKKISSKAPRFWRIFWTIGIFVSFCFTIYAFWFFFTNFIDLIFRPQITNVIAPLIPGVTISLQSFVYLILPLIIIMTTHELAHGISANVDGLEVKSSGVLGAGLFFLIGFGAFVEVDERKLRSSKYKRSTRLRVATSGTFVNAITAGIAFLLFFSFPYLISPYYQKTIQVESVLLSDDGGFNYGNLTKGDVIVAVKEGSGDYVYIDYNFDIGLYISVFQNKTIISCSVGDILTVLTYNPISDTIQEKNITLGPSYYYGIEFGKFNESAITITRIYTKVEGGNNYDKGLTVGQIFTEINGTAINYTTKNTLEKFLTNYNLQSLNLTALDSTQYSLNITNIGIRLGVIWNDYYYWMHKNDFAKFFTPAWPDFLYKTVFWLLAISFSITLFNMLPLPIFDGDRAVKEVINGVIGEGKYTIKKKKKEKFYYKKGDNKIHLSEFRVENVDYIKINLTKDKSTEKPSKIIKDNLTNQNDLSKEKPHVLIGKENYNLIDDLGDGFKDTILLNLPGETDLKEDSLIEVSYEYWQDERTKIKKSILYTLRLITLFIVVGNFVLSYVKFGFGLFWINL